MHGHPHPPARAAGILWALALVAAPAPPAAQAPAIAWGEWTEVASGDASRGPWRMNDSAFHYVDDPTVAADPAGGVAVLWAEQSRRDLFFQRYGAHGEARLEAPVNVSRSPDVFSWLPRVAFAPGDARRVYALWQEIVFSGGTHGGEAYFARSTDGGRTFSAPLNLSNSIAGDGKGRLTRRYWDNGSLDLTVGPEGRVYTAWTAYEGALWLARSEDGGVSFSAPAHIAGSGATPARGPALAVAAEGAVYLAWTVGEDPAADIRLARSTDGGRSFGAARVAVESPGHADAPAVAADPGGTLHLVYAESPEGPLRRYHVRYTRSDDGGRTFQAPTMLSEPVGPRSAGAHFPSLASDGAGGLYVLWERSPPGAHRGRGLGFTASGDGGRTFAPPSVVPGSDDPALGLNGSQQGRLIRRLAAGGDGLAVVVHSTFKPGEGSYIRLIRAQVHAR